MKYVKIKDLEPNMILAMTLYDNNEKLLLRTNKKLTNFHISKIKNLNYDGLYVYELEDDKIEFNSLIDEKTRLKTLKSLKHINIDKCLYLANEIVDEIKSNKSHIMELLNLSSYDNYTYMHSINVDILSVLLGIGLGFNDKDLRLLSQAALLHDIGKTCISKDILNKPTKLTEEEFDEIKKHPKYGYNLVKENIDISAIVKNAIYSHHENEDGTGYPRQLKADKIHKFAKIIHIADVYDALTSKRVYKEAINPGDAMEYLMANSNTLFNKEYVEVFMNYVALYPVGCDVELSDGSIGVVIENNDILSRPIVRLKNGKIVDLSKVLNLTIVNLLTK